MSSQNKNVTRDSLHIFVVFMILCSLAGLALAFPQKGETRKKSPQAVPTVAEAPPSEPDENLGVIEFRVRDSQTWYAVNAVVKYAEVEEGWADPRAQQTDGFGRVVLHMAPGHYLIELTAPGYNRLRTHRRVKPGTNMGGTVYLDPERPPQEFQPEVLARQLQPGHTLVHGFVVDVDTGKPLPNVHVRIEKAQAEAKTNTRGYYSISLPSPPTVQVKGVALPGMDDVIVQTKGHKKYIAHDLELPEGQDVGLSVELQQGSGIKQHDFTHKLRRDSTDQEPPQSAEPEPGVPPLDPRVRDWLSGSGKGLSLSEGTNLEAVSPLSVTVPTSITVGLVCSGTTCTSWETFTLESYVQQGLQDEWIATWTTDSLKAGAVAYRSYGAWFVDHPLSPDYDICNNTSCQKFTKRAKPAASTKAAATATAGVVLTRDGTGVIKAEYSAENNSVSGSSCRNNYMACDDGYVGSTNPAEDWPCMRDSLCQYEECAGHGRGMCQWGSSRWATGKNAAGAQVTTPRNWQCILDHYYNDNGNSTGAGSGDGLRTAWMDGPGGNGRIAFSRGDYTDSKIYTINPDGSDLRQISPRNVVDSMPNWEPGGGRVVFVSSSGYGWWAMNADGSGRLQLNASAESTGDFSLSPSGSGKIAFTCSRGGVGWGICTVNEDGSSRAELFYHPSYYSRGPCWSPDGLNIAFDHQTIIGGCQTDEQLFSMRSDGSGLTQLTDRGNGECAEWNAFPNWSPDGTMIAFAKAVPGGPGVDLYVMPALGGGQTRLIHGAIGEYNMYPSWSPDGKKIAFLRWNQDGTDPQIYVVQADGAAPTKITNVRSPGADAPDWSRCGRFDIP